MNFRQINLDFHTSEHIPGIGKKFNKEQFQNALKVGHVDSVTLFAKCHHGWMYYPSENFPIHPGLDFDLLSAQLDAAKEIGVKTPIYISVGFDEQAVRKHPEWRFQDRVHKFDNFSEAHYHVLCVNTGYLDYVLAQIKEVCEIFSPESIFLDIAFVRPCCCDSCVKSMMQLGMNPDDPEDILKFAEKAYATYVRRVRETVDSVNPKIGVFHNGGHVRHGRRDLALVNSHFELESLPTGGWGYDHFPFSARYVQNFDRDYLGMTGKFHGAWGEFGGFKHPNALRYEAALSAAYGAKCSVGDQLDPSGHMDMTTYELIGKAYAEIEQKEEWLDNVTPICDVALLSYESVQNLKFVVSDSSKPTDPDTGAGRILIEGKYQFSIIDTEMDFDKYKVLILPDEIVLPDNIIKKIKSFVEKGGKLLASGNSGIKDGKFLFDFGAEYLGDGEFLPSYIRPVGTETDYIMYTPYKKVKLTDGQELAEVAEPYFNKTPEHFCSHQHTPSSGVCNYSGIVSGKDGIYIAWKIFTDYAQYGEYAAKVAVLNALDLLLENDKVLETNLASMGTATLMQQKNQNRYVAHLLYAIPTKRGINTEIIEDIYPVHDITLKIRVPEDVKRVYLAPQNRDIEYTKKDGCIEVKDLIVDCHQMIVFDY